MSRWNVVRRSVPYIAHVIGWLIGLAAIVLGIVALLTPGEWKEGLAMIGLGWVNVLAGGIAAIAVAPHKGETPVKERATVAHGPVPGERRQ